MPTTDDPRLVRYLLGELREQEQTQLEEEYFASPEALERLAAAEDELIDDYVDGRLQGDARARFERRMWSSPARRQRIEFAQQLARYAGSGARRGHVSAFRRYAESPILQLATAAALFLSIGASIWMAFELRDLRRELTRVESVRRELADREQALTTAMEEQRRAAEQRNRQKPSERETPAKPAPIFAVSLVPGLVRSPGAATRIRLPATPATLRLELQVPPEVVQNYRLVVETARGREVWKQDRITPPTRSGSAPVVVVDLPARLFGPGDYVATLSGQTAAGSRDVAAYSFTIVRPL